ncbi:MAG: hypothetical protein ACLQK4_11175 [Acidimicrobiales bacterium]|jgi:hypothetical protein
MARSSLLLGAAAVALVASSVLASLPGGASGATAGMRAPHATTSSLDPYGPQGMNVDAAQKDFTTGDPDVVVAYVEGGINWRRSNAAALAGASYINWHDTPVPCSGSTVKTATMGLGGKTTACHTEYSSNESDYEIDGNKSVTVADWAHDPRVTDANHDGFLDPEDLIAAFSGASFNPPHPSPAGYSHAIAGWDFYDNAQGGGQNDPATIDAAYGHSDDQMNVIHTMCPSCLILPVKAGDEAVDSTEALAKAWLFAARSGARVIVSVTADLGYSPFEASVLRYLDEKGVIVVESSNDFDSADHQGGMFWGNVLPGNGLVPNTAGVPTGPVLKGMPGPEWTRSNETSFGPHNVFSVATNGGSTSESTPTLGGILGLVLSEGDEAAAAKTIPAPLSGPQAIQVLQEASHQLPGESKLPWPAGLGKWNPQYGYGMPDVAQALADVKASRIPPAAEIESPAWYSIEDPTTSASVKVTGNVESYDGTPVSWVLQEGLGEHPGAWKTIGSGSAPSGTYSGTLGTLSLSSIPKSFYLASFHLSTKKSLPSMDEYDVTFRLEASASPVAGHTLTAQTRRVVDVFHDPTALAHFPMAIGSSGESQPALVDLQGTGRLDIVFGTASGAVDAIDPKTGKELPGWPARTLPVKATDLPSGVKPGDEPVISDVAVGDLGHTGQLSVVATSLDGRVYVFDSHGKLQPGWPKLMSTGVVAPAIPRPSEPNVRLPVLGALAPPVLAPLRGGPDLDVIQAGWDGELHAWDATGSPLPGWPVHVTVPTKDLDLTTGYTLEDDQKLDTPPTLAYLSGKSGGADLVIRSQETEINTSASLQPFPYGFVLAYNSAGKLLPGWPVRLEGTIEDYGSAQEFITEGTDSPISADVLGNGKDEVAVGLVWSPESLIGGAGKVLGGYGTTLSVLLALDGIVNDPGAAINGPLPPTTPTPFTGSGAFGQLGSGIAFADPEMGAEHFAAALVYDGSGNPINQLLSVWPASSATSGGSGSELSSFPSAEQGQDFLGEPMFAPVAGAADAVVVSGDSGAVDARTATGKEAAGFPKFTGGWSIYAPSAGDLLSDGHDEIVTVTREGYLFVWKTSGTAPGASAWWRAYHDEWNTGRYGTDTRPPGVVRHAKIVPGGGTGGAPLLRFEAPGANWYAGRVSTYRLVIGGRTGSSIRDLTVHATVGAGHIQTIALPKGCTSVIVRAENSDGLVSQAEQVTLSASHVVAWPSA